jgi:hypothetical protein
MLIHVTKCLNAVLGSQNPQDRKDKCANLQRQDIDNTSSIIVSTLNEHNNDGDSRSEQVESTEHANKETRGCADRSWRQIQLESNRLRIRVHSFTRNSFLEDRAKSTNDAATAARSLLHICSFSRSHRDINILIDWLCRVHDSLRFHIFTAICRVNVLSCCYCFRYLRRVFQELLKRHRGTHTCRQ